MMTPLPSTLEPTERGGARGSNSRHHHHHHHHRSSRSHRAVADERSPPPLEAWYPAPLSAASTDLTVLRRGGGHGGGSGSRSLAGSLRSSTSSSLSANSARSARSSGGRLQAAPDGERAGVGLYGFGGSATPRGSNNGGKDEYWNGLMGMMKADSRFDNDAFNEDLSSSRSRAASAKTAKTLPAGNSNGNKSHWTDFYKTYYFGGRNYAEDEYDDTDATSYASSECDGGAVFDSASEPSMLSEWLVEKKKQRSRLRRKQASRSFAVVAAILATLAMFRASTGVADLLAAYSPSAGVSAARDFFGRMFQELKEKIEEVDNLHNHLRRNQDHRQEQQQHGGAANAMDKMLLSPSRDQRLEEAVRAERVRAHAQALREMNLRDHEKETFFPGQGQ